MIRNLSQFIWRVMGKHATEKEEQQSRKEPSAPFSWMEPEQLRSFVVGEPWSLGQFAYQNGELKIEGWAIPPGGDVRRVAFKINDHLFTQMEKGLHREDIANIYWFLPNAGHSGFQCSIHLPHDQVFIDGAATIQYVDAETGKPFRAEYNCYYCDENINRLIPVPDAARRKRVHGGTDENQFLIEGFTTYKKLELALQKQFGRGFSDYGRILDWGCGCGRVIRYLGSLPESKITGIDVDSDNITWCEEHLPFGEYRAIPLLPPTSLDANSFDLIFGISIFTHLDKQVELAWLAELQRIAAPEAVVLVTIHGENAISRISRLPEHLLSQLLTEGFLDVGENPDLDEVVKAGYYRNTFHTEKYIREEWTRYFQILDIIPGYIGNYHDLVIMKKQ